MKTRLPKTIVITGTRKGIGKHLVDHYVRKGFFVIGCSRGEIDFTYTNYKHFCLDVADETKVKSMFNYIKNNFDSLDVLINNAGIASMNHSILTPLSTVRNILDTNFIGTFLFCREAAKIMQKNHIGRIINFATIATPLKLEGEAIYSASKAAIVSLTEILARELGELGITVNAIAPTPVKTDLIRSVPKEKIDRLLNRQAIKRFGKFKDISNVTDFFISPKSDFITGQVIYLGGV